MPFKTMWHFSHLETPSSFWRHSYNSRTSFSLLNRVCCLYYYCTSLFSAWPSEDIDKRDILGEGIYPKMIYDAILRPFLSFWWRQSIRGLFRLFCKASCNERRASSSRMLIKRVSWLTFMREKCQHIHNLFAHWSSRCKWWLKTCVTSTSWWWW